MDFYIRSGSNLPILKVLLITDGRPDFDSIISNIESSRLFFSIYNIKTGLAKFERRPCIVSQFIDSNGNTKYYIEFQFKRKDTTNDGVYRGEFSISVGEENFILPLGEELKIYILNTISSVDTCCPVLITPTI